ncbi:hypothetical protein H4R19_005364, partial [Coemansia spiralis]
DVQHAVRFFSAIRNSQLARIHEEAACADPSASTDSVSRNFLGDASSADATAVPTAAVSASSSWARVKRAVDSTPQ